MPGDARRTRPSLTPAAVRFPAARGARWGLLASRTGHLGQGLAVGAPRRGVPEGKVLPALGLRADVLDSLGTAVYGGAHRLG